MNMMVTICMGEPTTSSRCWRVTLLVPLSLRVTGQARTFIAGVESFPSLKAKSVSRDWRAQAGVRVRCSRVLPTAC